MKGLKFMGKKEVKQLNALAYLGAKTDAEAIQMIDVLVQPPVGITLLATPASGVQIMLSTMCTPEIALAIMNRASTLILDRMQKETPAEEVHAEIQAEGDVA